MSILNTTALESNEVRFLIRVLYKSGHNCLLYWFPSSNVLEVSVHVTDVIKSLLCWTKILAGHWYCLLPELWHNAPPCLAFSDLCLCLSFHAVFILVCINFLYNPQVVELFLINQMHCSFKSWHECVSLWMQDNSNHQNYWWPVWAVQRSGFKCIQMRH